MFDLSDLILTGLACAAGGAYAVWRYCPEPEIESINLEVSDDFRSLAKNLNHAADQGCGRFRIDIGDTGYSVTIIQPSDRDKLEQLL